MEGYHTFQLSICAEPDNLHRFIAVLILTAGNIIEKNIGINQNYHIFH